MLNTYLPNNFNTEEVLQLLKIHDCRLTITPPRKTKLGDFKINIVGYPNPIITINNNLNKFAFAVTLLHEIAHLLVWINNKNYLKLKPHGYEWKKEFKALLVKHIRDFPTDIQDALLLYMQNPKASSCTDSNLKKTLQNYNAKNNLLLVENIEIGSLFILNGRTFKKGSLLRKHYKCLELASKKEYRVHALAEVEIL